MSYIARKCPCGNPVCKSGYVSPLMPVMQGGMSYEDAVKVAALLNASDPLKRPDPRGQFEELNERLDKIGETDLNGIFDNNPAELIELLETGSVTLKLFNYEGVLTNWVLTLNVQEQK